MVTKVDATALGPTEKTVEIVSAVDILYDALGKRHTKGRIATVGEDFLKNNPSIGDLHSPDVKQAVEKSAVSAIETGISDWLSRRLKLSGK